MARKRKWVPEVLWRLFGDRARTLADTILALIPPPLDKAAGCRCKGRRCFSCSGDEAMSFLVRPDDPSDYRKLLTGCFVVVSENAPPIAAADPHCRWSQREIVRRTIEMKMSEQPSSSNLICCNYNRENRSSAVFDALTSSNWTLLLTRVGDALMMYLLKHSSIFLPLPRNKHHQIAGFPISDLCTNLSRPMSEYKYQNHPLAVTGTRKKRKRVEGVESIPGKQLCMHSSDSLPASRTFKVDGSNGSGCVLNEELSDEKCEGSLKQNTVSSMKRIRLYRWQRERERKHLTVCRICSSISCNCNLSRELQNGIPASSGQCDETNFSHCFCCEVFQNVPKMDKNAEIDRKNIFYRLESSTSLLPRKRILLGISIAVYPDIIYTLKPDDCGASALFSKIFGTSAFNKNTGEIPCFHSNNSCPLTSTCLYHSLTKLLKNLIRETQNCRHMRLLDKHCSIRSSYQDSRRDDATEFQESDSRTNLFMNKQEGNQIVGKLSHVDNTENPKMLPEASVEPSKHFCPKEKVVSFIWAICKRIVPSPLMGETSNWRVLRKNISKFIQLRKFEKFSLKQCIHKLKISKFPLLSNKHGELGITDIARHAILECWIFWFFAHLVSPLVQANFYVTESELEKQEVLYYRKSIWEKLIREAECMNYERYRLIDDASTRRILRKRLFGFSRARLRPKHIGFRILTNLQAPSRMPVNPLPSSIRTNQKVQRKAFANNRVKPQFFKSVNSVLHDLHVVLKGLWTKEPEKFGSSVFNYNDVYRKLLPFLFLLKNGSTNMLPNVFIVVSDVSKAFDSVNQDKLLSVMKDIILDKEYTLEKFTQVIHTKKCLKVHQHLTLAQKGNVTASSKITSRLHAQSLGSVLVKKDFGRKIRKEEINSILEEHIKCNVVQFSNNFYLQRVGIPQGSVLSSLLCSFYYGHMERNVVFPFLEKANDNLLGQYDTNGKEMFACGSGYLLLRLIDDFLFISTSKKQASMFFSRLERGFRDYNCYMNVEKYGLNFDLDNRQGCQSNRLHVGKDGVSFLCWSGLLVNCSTLEIQADYTRYVNSHLSSTLTVNCQGKVGSQLKERLRSYLRPKCHPIFYDSNINSAGVVRLNIYQLFLLCAMKFICYISKLSVLPRFTPNFYINAICSSLRYMNRLIKRKMYSFDTESAFRPKYDVKRKDVIWLGLYAYCRVLKKKQSRYKKLLCLFRSKLKAYGKIKNLSPELRYAIDDAHSSVLWRIKF